MQFCKGSTNFFLLKCYNDLPQSIILMLSAIKVFNENILSNNEAFLFMMIYFKLFESFEGKNKKIKRMSL